MIVNGRRHLVLRMSMPGQLAFFGLSYRRDSAGDYLPKTLKPPTVGSTSMIEYAPSSMFWPKDIAESALHS